MCSAHGLTNPFCLYTQPTVAAIEAGKDIALANKETLIAGGPFVLPLAHKHKVKILPADSEHSAVFQVLAREHPVPAGDCVLFLVPYRLDEFPWFYLCL